MGAPSQPPVTITHTSSLPISSQILHRGLVLSIFAPWNYHQTGMRYPVMYLLDAEFNFPLMVGLQDGLHYGGKTPEMLIVGIGYGEPYGVLMKERARDFTPAAVGQIEGSGKAERYLQFMEQELIPFIEGNYRTVPSERILVGHSFSGAFAGFTALRRPGLFKRVIAASPALQHFQGTLLNELDQALSEKRLKPSRVDFSFGSQELNFETFPKFEQRINEVEVPGVFLRVSVYPEENHTSVKALAFSYAMRWLWKTGA